MKRWIVKFLVLCVSAAVLSSAASATVVKRGGSVRIVGEISADEQTNFALAFTELMLSAEPSQEIPLILNSHGGDIRGALAIVKVIRAAQAYGTEIHAHVPPAGECSSACVAILAVADRRTVAPDSLLVVHGVRYVGPREDVAEELQTYSEESLKVIETADNRFGRFLRQNQIIERNLELQFSGADLSAAFGGFVESVN